MTLNREQLLQSLSSVCPNWPSGDIGEFHFLEGGYSNANYRFAYNDEPFVLRVPRHTQPFIDRHWEADWYAKLPELGVPTTPSSPSSISSTPSPPPIPLQIVPPIALDAKTGIMVTAWIEGELLVDAFASGLVSVVDIQNFVIQFHNKLPTANRRYPLDELLKVYAAGSPAPDAGLANSQHQPQYAQSEAARIRRVALAQASHTTCHNDLNPWNVIVTPSHWIVLDWEMAGRNDPLFDAVALLEGLAMPRTILHRLAEHLTMNSPASPKAGPSQNLASLTQRVEDNLFGFWCRELYWARYQIRQGNVRPEILEQVETAHAALHELAQQFGS